MKSRAQEFQSSQVKMMSSATPPLAAEMQSVSSNSLSKEDYKRIERDYLTRWIFNTKNIGTVGQLPKAIFDYKAGNTDQAAVPEVSQVETVVDASSGLIIAVTLHFIFKGKYHRYHQYRLKQPLNPTHFKFSTLAKFGGTVGNVVANLDVIPISDPYRPIFQNITSSVFNLAFSILAVIYDVVQYKILKKPPSETKYAKVGKEGWVSYGYAFNQFGIFLGQPLGALWATLKQTSIDTTMYLAGGIAGIVSFVVGLIAVPIINWLCKNKLISNDSDTFRSNYVITGLTLGGALGTVIGFAIDLFAPGLGTTVMMTLFGAIGSVVGGAYIGAKGESITRRIKEKYFPNKETENPWHYTTRTVSSMGLSIGALIGFFIPVPGGAAIGALIGGAIGSTIGWFTGIYAIKKARELVPEEQKAPSLSWTQWVGAGNFTGYVIGMAIGLVVGLLGGPLGVGLGITLGGAIGGVVGGMIGSLLSKSSRNTLKRMIGMQADVTVPPTDELIEISESTPPNSLERNNSHSAILKTISLMQENDEPISSMNLLSLSPTMCSRASNEPFTPKKSKEKNSFEPNVTLPRNHYSRINRNKYRPTLFTISENAAIDDKTQQAQNSPISQSRTAFETRR